MRHAALPLVAATVAACALAPGAWAGGGRPHVVVRHAVAFGISKPLRDARPARRLLGAMPSPIVNVQGQSRNGYVPSDANGAVGPNNYVQMVNTTIAVYDKTGAVVQAATAIHNLWSALTDHANPCFASDGGDPVVLYDHLANRWLISQLGYGPGVTGPFYECIAASRTGDPAGSWYAYAFQTSTTLLGDYPKLGVWPDAYYMSVNQFAEPGDVFKGAGVAAFDRAALIAGDAGARMVYIDTFPTYGTTLAGLLPADWDGARPPAAGMAAPFVQLDTTQLEVWQFHVDWTTTSSSTFTHVTDLAVSPYTPACSSGGPITSCIAQKNTAQGLDPLSDRLMYRLQYRNFGDHQSLVVSHTVDTGSSIGGIRWYELRNSGSGWTKNQEGTYAPGDAVSRWMGSLAMDGAGDMALGFSASGTSIFPDVRYVGRLVGDAAGTLPQTEVAAAAGDASQAGAARWGDYSSMSVDPTDDCTFWYTQQYLLLAVNGWTTRIFSFKFPSCTGGSTVLPVSLAAPTVSGTVATGQTLTATDGTWTGAQPFTATAFHWQQCDATGASCVTSSHDTGSASYPVDVSDIGHTIRVAVTRTNELGSGTGTSTASSLPTTTLPVNTAVPSVTTTTAIRDGENVTAAEGTWSHAPTSFAYRWQRCSSSSASSCADVGGAIARTYMLAHADAEKWIRVGVAGVNADGTGPVAYSQTYQVLAVAPASATLPSVSGTAQEGRTLTADPGTWSGSPATFTYSWSRCSSAGGSCTSGVASGATYVPLAADIGSTLRVVVTATNGAGSMSATSAATAVVLIAAPANVTAPTVTAATAIRDGEQVSAVTSVSDWTKSPTSFVYRWQRCSSSDASSCMDISGATSSSYMLAHADAEKWIRVGVAGVNAGGTGAVAYSQLYPVLAIAPASSALPSVSGTAQEGETLTATPGTWSGSPATYAYSWSRCDASGGSCTAGVATGATYVPVAADVGSTFKVLVTATNGAGSASATSAATAVVLPAPPANSVAPTVTAATAIRDGEQVSAATAAADWTNHPTSFAYQWQRCSSNAASSCVDVSGATSSAYTLVHADAEKWIRVGVAGVNAGGTGSLAYSQLYPVLAVAPANTALPSVSGTATEGQTLTASSGTWSGSPATYAYSWSRCDASGGSCSTGVGTGSSYTPGSADRGHTLRVVVTATNGGGSASATSAATAVVPAPATQTAGTSGDSGGGGGGGGIPPDVHVDLTANAASAPGAGSQLIYFVTVSVRNVGSASAVALDLALPAGFTVTQTFSDRGPGCTGTAPSLACDVAWIAPGVSTHVTIWGTVGQAGELDATATVRSLVERELDATDNTATLRLLPVAPPSPPGDSSRSAAPAATTPPALRGAAAPGATLRVTPPAWSATPTRVTYQWQLCTAKGCTPIAGATKPSLKLSAAYTGRSVRVVATATIAGRTVKSASKQVAVKKPARRLG